MKVNLTNTKPKWNKTPLNNWRIFATKIEKKKKTTTVMQCHDNETSYENYNYPDPLVLSKSGPGLIVFALIKQSTGFLRQQYIDQRPGQLIPDRSDGPSSTEHNKCRIYAVKDLFKERPCLIFYDLLVSSSRPLLSSAFD